MYVSNYCKNFNYQKILTPNEITRDQISGIHCVFSCPFPHPIISAALSSYDLSRKNFFFLISSLSPCLKSTTNPLSSRCRVPVTMPCNWVISDSLNLSIYFTLTSIENINKPKTHTLFREIEDSVHFKLC